MAQRSVVRGVHEVLEQSRVNLTVKQIAERVGAPQSSVRRILYEMKRAGTAVAVVGVGMNTWQTALRRVEETPVLAPALEQPPVLEQQVSDEGPESWDDVFGVEPENGEDHLD